MRHVKFTLEFDTNDSPDKLRSSLNYVMELVRELPASGTDINALGRLEISETQVTKTEWNGNQGMWRNVI